jgi:hypothetical protein
MFTIHIHTLHSKTAASKIELLNNLKIKHPLCNLSDILTGDDLQEISAINAERRPGIL